MVAVSKVSVSKSSSGPSRHAGTASAGTGPPGVGHRTFPSPTRRRRPGAANAAVVTGTSSTSISKRSPTATADRPSTSTNRSPGRTRQGRLGRVEQAAVGGFRSLSWAIERTATRTRRRPSRRWPSSSVGGGSVLQSHPRLGDDAERALGPEHQAVRRRTRPGTEQAERLADADQGDYAMTGLDEVVDVGPQGGVVRRPGWRSSRPGWRNSKPGGRSAGEVGGAELVLERGSQHTGAGCGRPDWSGRSPARGPGRSGRGSPHWRAEPAGTPRRRRPRTHRRTGRPRRPRPTPSRARRRRRPRHAGGARRRSRPRRRAGPGSRRGRPCRGRGSAGLRRAVADRAGAARHCGTGAPAGRDR